ncbi:MAG: DUF3307 domain-containing protein [Pseudomonadota bacterium]
MLLLIAALQLKHFVADYLLQNEWIIRGKRSFTHLGGYVHAGVHAIGTIVTLGVLTGLGAREVLLIGGAEFVVHYLLDFAKAHYGDHYTSVDEPKRFWAAHGFDQMLHHFTYLTIAYAVVTISA